MHTQIEVSHRLDGRDMNDTTTLLAALRHLEASKETDEKGIELMGKVHDEIKSLVQRAFDNGRNFEKDNNQK